MSAHHRLNIALSSILGGGWFTPVGRAPTRTGPIIPEDASVTTETQPRVETKRDRQRARRQEKRRLEGGMKRSRKHRKGR